MADRITEIVEHAVGSPWVYLALFAFAALDAFFPIVPSESLVISAGVFAASGSEPDLVPIILAAAAGAFLGDHISYFIGRTAGARLMLRTREGSKKARAFRQAGKLIDERGGVILVVCRYIPGARTAITLTAGAVRYPLRKFSLFDGIAALSWGVYSATVGYVGGEAFEEDPLKGLGLGLGIALAVSALVEGVRHVRARRVAA
ncbi:MAG TPA: DedA family protein [Solirubrobacteraceae bacterium]|jgi:membrane protein DedA with SNARE-associated domain|nr:DedA family protein [Solirubrobacteraceae bacterium]